MIHFLFYQNEKLAQVYILFMPITNTGNLTKEVLFLVVCVSSFCL